MDKLKTEVKIPASIALNGLLGQPAVFIPKLQSLKSKRYPAKIIFVYPEANPVSASVRVWVEIDNQDLELIAGLTGRLEISRQAGTIGLIESAVK